MASNGSALQPAMQRRRVFTTNISTIVTAENHTAVLATTEKLPDTPVYDSTLKTLTSTTNPFPTSTTNLHSTSTTLPKFETFSSTGKPICTVDGKPVLRMFGKKNCEQCLWGAPIYDGVVSSYGDRILAIHWDFDLGDDLLTYELEDGVPDSEIQIFFGGSKTGTVPYFNFGCMFERVGNGYYVRGDKGAEAQEMRMIISYLNSL